MARGIAIVNVATTSVISPSTSMTAITITTTITDTITNTMTSNDATVDITGPRHRAKRLPAPEAWGTRIRQPRVSIGVYVYIYIHTYTHTYMI